MTFSSWWAKEYDNRENPFQLNSPEYWAWAGWNAAQKQWVGLTTEEIHKSVISTGIHVFEGDIYKFVDTLEGLLRRKNT